MRAGLEGPLPGGAAQPRMALQHGRRRNRISRMQIDRRVQGLGPLPEWIERRVIEIDPVAVAVDHDAAEAELTDAALELVGGYAWILQRHMPEAGIAVRPPLDFLGEE